MTKSTRRASRASAGSGNSNAPTEFNPDYSHVIRDMKRIGVLAGSFLVVLIALSFIIK